MNKALSWAVALIVGLGVLVYVCGKVVLDSSSAMRDRAVETLRVTALELPNRTDGSPVRAPALVLPASNTPLAGKTPPSSGDPCASWAERWNDLADAIEARGGTVLFLEISNGFQKIPELGGQSRSPDARLDGAWAALSVLKDEWAEEIGQARQLAAEYDPSCSYLSEQDAYGSRNLNFVYLLNLAHVLSVHQNDFDAAISGFAATTLVKFSPNEPFDPTRRITRDDAELIFDAIRSGTVQADTWDYLLAQLREARHQNFMRFYLLHYGDTPMGGLYARYAQSNFVVRELARIVTEPGHYRDLAEWTPVMQQLAELSEEPYYSVREDVMNVISTHHLGGPDAEGRSGAWRLVSVLATSRMLEQASAQAGNDLVRLSIALARYHEDHEEYPVTLEDTAPYLGEPVPLNPRNGVPYHYEALDGTYRLGFGEDEASSLSRFSNVLVPEIGPEGAEFIRVPTPMAPRPKVAARSDGQPG